MRGEMLLGLPWTVNDTAVLGKGDSVVGQMRNAGIPLKNDPLFEYTSRPMGIGCHRRLLRGKRCVKFRKIVLHVVMLSGEM